MSTIRRVSMWAARGLALAALAAPLSAQGSQPPAAAPRTAAGFVEPLAAEARGPGPFTPVAVAPFAVAGPRAVRVDMARVPVTPDRAKSLGPDRTHVQGELSQHQHGGGSRSPLITGDRGAPTVELDRAPAATAGPAAPAAPGNHVVAFDASPFTGWIPPDTVLAVGPEYIVEAVNSGFTVYDKTGGQARAYTDFESFVLLPEPWDGYCYDPRVVYDPGSGRFVMLILGLDNTNLKSWFWLMVSETSNPNGNWWLYLYDATTGSPSDPQWLDYASLGVDAWGVYVVGNSFEFAPGTPFVESQLWTLGPSVMSGGSGDGTFWRDLRWPNGVPAFALQVAHPHTQDPLARTYLVNSYPASGTDLCLWSVSGDRVAGQGLGTATLSRTATYARSYFAIYNNVDQPGSTWDLDGGDCRVLNAVYSQGKVYTTMTLDWDNSHSYSEAYVIALNTGDGSKAWDFSLWSPDFFMFYPAVTVEGDDPDPNWMVTMSMTAPAESDGWAGSIALTYDPVAGTGPFWWDHKGDGPYSRWDGAFEGDGRNRWGDYSMSVYDWTCHNAWGAAEYATSSNTWGTRIFSRTMDDEAPCPYVHVVNPNGGESITAGTTVNVAWTSMNIPTGDELWVRYFDGQDLHDYGPLAATATSYLLSVPNAPTASDAAVMVGSWDPSGMDWRTADSSDFDFAVTGLPDLQAVGLTVPSSPVGIGETVDVSDALQNVGPAAAGAFDVELRLSSNSICSTADDLLASRTVAGLAAGASGGATTPVTVPPGTAAGTRYVCQLIDPANAETEFDEGNNTLYAAITVIDPEIFADGFEGGTLSAWSSYTP